MAQQSDLHAVPWYKPRLFAFGFNKVLMVALLSMVQCINSR